MAGVQVGQAYGGGARQTDGGEGQGWMYGAGKTGGVQVGQARRGGAYRCWGRDKAGCAGGE